MAWKTKMPSNTYSLIDIKSYEIPIIDTWVPIYKMGIFANAKLLMHILKLKCYVFVGLVS